MSLRSTVGALARAAGDLATHVREDLDAAVRLTLLLHPQFFYPDGPAAASARIAVTVNHRSFTSARKA